MARKFTPVEETLKLSELLSQKPEIEKRVNYYKSILISLDKKVKGINEILDQVKDANEGRSGINMNNYEASKLELEKIEAEADIFAKQQYYESWLKRSSEFAKKEAEVTADCNANYDSIFSQATELRGKNFRLDENMSKYKNDNNDQTLKNEYYLYLKQEVENYIQYSKDPKKKKFSVPSQN